MTVASKAMYIVLLFTLINFSAGLHFNLIKDVNGANFFNPSYGLGYTFDEDGSLMRNATANLETDVQSSGETEDKSSLIDRVLDVMALGFIIKIKDFISTGLFGIVDMVQIMFGSYLDENVESMLFGGIRFGIFMIYVVAIVGWFSDKKIVEVVR